MIQTSDYIEKPAPKSLDPSEFYLIDELDELSIYDACTTLEAFTALSIVNSVGINIPKKWVLAGGGWNNPVILKYLKEYLPKECEIFFASEIGLDSVYMEAELFAYLAARSFYKLPISFPLVTGCKQPTLGGSMYLPRSLACVVEAIDL